MYDDWTSHAKWWGEEFLRTRGHAASEVSKTGKVKRVRATARHLGVGSLVELAGLLSTRDGAVHVLETLREAVTPTTLRGYIFALLTLQEWAAATGVIEQGYLTRQDAPPTQKRSSISVYSTAEIDALLAASDPSCSHPQHSSVAACPSCVRWPIFLRTLFLTGMRSGEALGVRWEHLRLDGDQPYLELPRTKTVPRLVPLPHSLAATLANPATRELLQQDPGFIRPFVKSPATYLFPLGYDSARRRLQAACERAGVPYRAGLHSTRHSFATRLLATGAPLVGVSKLLGHANITTTVQYYSHTESLGWSHLLDD